MSDVATIDAPVEREVLITEPGLHDIPCDAYFAEPCPTPAATNSILGLLMGRTPAHAARAHPAIGQAPEERKATAAMHRGSVVHRLALGKGKDYVIIDAGDYRTNAAKEARDEAEAAGMVPILAKVFKEAEKQAPVVRAHLDELLFGEDFIPELTVAWQEETPHGLVWCRGMIDAWCPRLLKAVDLKSTTNASEEAATRRIADGGYAQQEAWYTRGIGQAIGEPGRIGWATLFVENDPPFESQPFTIDEAWRTMAWDHCEAGLNIFAKCLSRDEWPGYRRQIQTISPPPWVVSKHLAHRYSFGAE